MILDGITADVGKTVAVVIRGDGMNGVFVGRLAAVSLNEISLLLTRPVGPIPAGVIVAILRGEIAAAARLASSGTQLHP